MSSTPPVQEREWQERKIRELQTLIEKSSNYTRLVMGLGYGGFVAVWSGTKQYLPAKYAVLSALLLLVSVFLFIAYLVLEIAVFSHWNASVARLWNADEQIRAAKAEGLTKRFQRISWSMAIVWPPIFYLCVGTGFGGVAILAWGFGRALHAMW